MKSTDAKNRAITETTNNTEIKALLTCSFVGNITFDSSSLDNL